MLVLKLLFAGLWLAAWGFVVGLMVWDEINWRRNYKSKIEKNRNGGP